MDWVRHPWAGLWVRLRDGLPDSAALDQRGDLDRARGLEAALGLGRVRGLGLLRGGDGPTRLETKALHMARRHMLHNNEKAVGPKCPNELEDVLLVRFFLRLHGQVPGAGDRAAGEV